MKNKLCPLRKSVVNYSDVISNGRCIKILKRVPATDMEYTEETFLPCIKEECMFYNSSFKQCAITTKFTIMVDS